MNKTIEEKTLKQIVKTSRWFEKCFDGDVNRLDRCLKAYKMIKSEVCLQEFIHIVAVDKFGSIKEKEMLKEMLKDE